MFRAPLLASVALAALLPVAAAAQCLPDPVGNGGTVTCSATDTNGLTTSATGITVDVQAGASVTAAGDALRLNGTNTTVGNGGTIDGGDEGIDIRATNGTITNAAGALIRGGDRGIDANETADGLTITNNGQITGTASDAIRGLANVTVTNNAGATISGGDEGVQVTSDLSLTNHGTITAADEGIEATDNATFTNTGTISAVDDAIQADDNTTITNSGLIESSENDAIDIDSGSVTNTGTIRATGTTDDGIDFDPLAANVVSTVDNRAGALIEGTVGINVDLANDRAQAIINAGTIRGRSGIALFLEDGDDSLDLLSGGIVDGTADFGAGNDVLTILGIHAGPVGGGGLFDGGEGEDRVAFDFSLDDALSLFDLPLIPGGFDLAFANADGSQGAIRLAGFETFVFASQTVGLGDLRRSLAPVPLPATGLLLLGGLGLILAARRRRET